ncbi:hypothetical protein FOA43_000375 [Brettanomyces nanus]|uniref:Sugar phosphate transporter domain-containing protein n=1 Tax=Eeniella nana TaxID=13502 RepID=A0A875RN18_EENNA|nr:uncharacterized protein FOA43_000375 [Brettanomyces nanus]QPG73070.1 hypothetical protein FOA43_000375 [Brettanomyces nanus]
MLGVMLSCIKPDGLTHEDDSYFHTGCIFAFISMLIFVSQNIFAKKFLTYEAHNHNDAFGTADDGFVNALNIQITKSESAATTPILPVSLSFDEKKELSSNRPPSFPVTPFYGNSSQSLNEMVKDSDRRLDKISVLFYCSVVGLSFTFPFYIISEFTNPVFSLSLINKHIIGLMLIYGIAHFMQSIVAFQILGLISPINYSIANIMKRITVISWSIFLEGTQLMAIQWAGLVLTFSGLYAYDRWGRSKE